MNRRGFIAGAGVAVPTLLAGCLNAASPGEDDGGEGGDSTDGDGSDGGDDEDTVPVLTGHQVSQGVATPDVERSSDMDAWGLFVASREAADTYYGDADDEQVTSFVEETAFDAGERLVFLQAHAPQTCYELVLDGDPYVASNGIPTVEGVTERTAPEDQACGDAMTPVEVLLRLSFDPDAGPTDVLEAKISGHRDRSEALTLEAER